MILETILADNGFCITLLDQTLHYFGGYYHVKVLAYGDIPIERCCFDDDSEFCDAIVKIGSSVRYERVLEKMAVPESDIDSVREQLLRDFRKTASAYLVAPDFVCRFIRSEYRKSLQKNSRFNSARV